MLPSVRAVVLNYNGGDLVVRCVESLRKTDWPADRLDIVVVDNASADGSAEYLNRTYDDITVMFNAHNDGFPANNLAMRSIDDHAYVALINPDTTVDPGWLRPLVEAMEEDDGLGAVSPRMLLEPRFVDVAVDAPTHQVRGDDRDLGVRVTGVRVDGVDRLRQLHITRNGWGAESTDQGRHHWLSGDAVVAVPFDPDAPTPEHVSLQLVVEPAKDVRLGNEVVHVGPDARWFDVAVDSEPYDLVNNAGSLLVEGGWGADRGLGTRDSDVFDESCEVFAWCGGAVLLRSTYLREVGLFDERFFLYYEDTDLSWRGRAQGWRYRYVPDSRIRHVHAASTVEGSSMFVHFVERNRLLMLAKNAPLAFALRAYLRFVLSTLGIAREQVFRPMMRGSRPDPTTVLRRIRAFVAAVGLLPYAARQRRGLRRAQVVDDAALLAWQVRQP
ncbi:glycosyltransferase [Actinospongicola halichondriae]|uniref:glycosyltransferase n=1 Tax=Actinospongicola halichondriae TaxID=3236844 RepID=UPI003D3924E5